jgi:BirA family biotin operon repressor/biotin-[acetyl-CoA-carboxylase] ligase
MKFSLLTFDTLESTNTEALNRARLGAKEGVCVIARQQTAGRGRYGRIWISQRDAGLYFSVILRPKIAANDLPLITLMAGVAVHDTLQSFGIGPDVKWVNDVLVNDRKIAGILAETTETETGLAVIVGIGINLTHANFPSDLSVKATSLEEVMKTPVRREELIERLTHHLAAGYALLQTQSGPAEMIERWKRRSSYSSGKPVRVVLESENVTGVTDGLEKNGALRIRRSDGTTVIVQAGDVEQLRAAANLHD